MRFFSPALVRTRPLFAMLIAVTTSFALNVQSANAQLHADAPTMNFTQESELMGSGPAMAVFNNKMYIAFQGQNSNHLLFIDSSADGVTLNGAVQFASIALGSAPALAAFNGKLYVAFRAKNGSNILYVCSTSDVQNFSCQGLTNSQGTSGSFTIGAPSMTVFQNKLYIAFETQTGNQLAITSSSDGVNFPALPTVYSTTMGSPPAIATYENQLIIAYQANDSSHDLFLQASNNGTTLLAATQYATKIKTTPALAVTDSAQAPYSTLMIAFEGNDSNQNIWFEPYQTGNAYAATQNAGQIGSAPAELVWTPPVGQFAGQETIFAAFRSFNSSDRLFLGGQKTVYNTY